MIKQIKYNRLLNQFRDYFISEDNYELQLSDIRGFYRNKKTNKRVVMFGIFSITIYYHNLTFIDGLVEEDVINIIDELLNLNKLKIDVKYQGN